jgi:diacylglycerol kinase (ATP)
MAGELACAAVESGCDLILAAGGDGTINEVLNGLAESSLPLALLPLGTANVLAAEIGLVCSPRRIAEAIARGQPRPVYLGSANGRRFAMMAGVGFDAHVVGRMDLRMKRALGKAAYVLGALGEFWRHRPTHYRVEIDGSSYPAAAVIVAKGHFYGGRFVVAREARLDQPRLQVALFERAGRWNVLRYLAAMVLGRLDRLPGLRVLAAERLTIGGPAGEPVQADGDLVAELPLSVTLAERPIALITG